MSRFVVGCGCGWDWYVQNAGWIKTARADADPAPCGKCPFDEEPSVVNELGWCGCGNPEDVDRMMLAYLRNINDRWTVRKDEGDPYFGWRATEGLSADAETLIQYIADSLGWTEHGGTVGGAWLTDRGREALANLART